MLRTRWGGGGGEDWTRNANRTIGLKGDCGIITRGMKEIKMSIKES